MSKQFIRPLSLGYVSGCLVQIAAIGYNVNSLQRVCKRVFWQLWTEQGLRKEA